MKASILSIVSLVASAGLIKAAPVSIFEVGDHFHVGDPPKPNRNGDNVDANKVVAIPTKFKGNRRKILLTRAQNSSKGMEFVRGKRKFYETTAEGAHREAWEESEKPHWRFSYCTKLT